MVQYRRAHQWAYGVRLVDPGNLVSASGGIANTPATAAATNTSNPDQ